MLVGTVGLAAFGALCGAVTLWVGPSLLLGSAAIALSTAALGVLALIWRYPRRRGGMRPHAAFTLILVVIALSLAFLGVQ